MRSWKGVGRLAGAFELFCELEPSPEGCCWTVEAVRGGGGKRRLYFLALRDGADVVTPVTQGRYYLSEMAAFLEGLTAMRVWQEREKA